MLCFSVGLHNLAKINKLINENEDKYTKKLRKKYITIAIYLINYSDLIIILFDITTVKLQY